MSRGSCRKFLDIYLDCDYAERCRHDLSAASKPMPQHLCLLRRNKHQTLGIALDGPRTASSYDIRQAFFLKTGL